MNSTRGLTIIGVIVVILGVVAFSSMYEVRQTEQALVLQFGDPVGVDTEPGLKFKLPFVQNVVTYDRRVLDLNPDPEEIIAADNKRIVVDTYARYRITDPLLFFQTVGTEEGVQVRLDRIVNSALRGVVGRVPMSALLTEQRSQIMATVQKRVAQEAAPFGIKVIDVRIRRADLPQANSEAIYARMKSERVRQAKQLRAMGAEQAARIRAEADKDRTIILAKAHQKAQELRGQGDGQAQAIYNAAYSGDAQEFYEFYRRMRAFRDTFSSGNASFVLSPDSDFFRYFSNIDGKPKPGPATAAPAQGAKAAARN